jgi:hypothetical protein
MLTASDKHATAEHDHTSATRGNSGEAAVPIELPITSDRPTLLERPTHTPSMMLSTDIHTYTHENSHPLSSSPSQSGATGPVQIPTTLSQFESYPTWSKPTKSVDTNLDATNTILVDLPRVICDLTLPSRLSQNVEQVHLQEHILTSAMKHVMLSSLADSKMMYYNLNDISLSFKRSTNHKNNKDSTRIRSHVYFTGTSQWSLQEGAPTSRELTWFLINHFSVDQFQARLVPKATRAAGNRAESISIKVNSVFFTLVRINAEDRVPELVLAASYFVLVPPLTCSTAKRRMAP